VSTEELITIQEFAERYRVGTETVRSWVREGLIDYELVGPRKMIRKSAVLKPVVEEKHD
jgi:excisionase family DNA binding protein